MEQKIYNLIILDESGSMNSIRTQAITGVNETLQTIKAAQEKYEEQKHYVSLVSFNTERVKTIFDCCPGHRINELSSCDYVPNACTPLYDAMGTSLTKLKQLVKDEDKVLVTIITDGYENASREYSGKAIAQLVEELKAKGWIFTYIGANQDVEKVASSMGIRNRLAFDANLDGTREMFRKERNCRAQYYGRVHKEPEFSVNIQESFFDLDETKKEEKPEKKNVEDKKKNKWWPF